MKKYFAFLLISAMLFNLCSCKKKEVNSTPKHQVMATNVTVTEVLLDNIDDSVTYTGEIKASEATSIASKISGNAVAVYKKVGDKVNAGDILAKVDDTDYQAAYKKAQASYKQIQAVVSQAEASEKQAEAALQQAKSSVKQAEAATKQTEVMCIQAQSGYEQAQASYNSAVASYNSATNGSAQQTKNQLAAALETAKLAYDNEKANYERQKILFESGAATKVQYDAALTSYENAKLNYETAKSNYDLTIGVILEESAVNAQAGVNTAQAAVQSAQAAIQGANAQRESSLAQLESAKIAVSSAEAQKESVKAQKQSALAQLESARLNVESASNSLNDTVIKAPISGYITSKNTNKGQLISPGVELFAIKSTHTIDAEIHVTEAVIPFVSIGTEAVVSVKSVNLKDIEGTVTSVNPVKDNKTGLYTVSIAIDNSNDMLKDGMFADITLITASSKDTLIIPSDSVLEDEDGNKYVYIAEDNKAKRCNIKVGIATDELTEVISGLKKGQKVIMEGKEYLSDKNNDIKIVK